MFFAAKMILLRIRLFALLSLLATSPFEQRLEIAVGEKTSHVEIAGDRVFNQLAVAFHLRHVISADRDIKTDFAIGTHKRKLVGVALIVEKLHEVGLVVFNIPYVDEGDALSEVTRNTA